MNKSPDVEAPKVILQRENKPNTKMLTVADYLISDIQALLQKYTLNLKILKDDQAITGSFWGESEAGLIENTLFVRTDTPIHSLLHETCHFICMDSNRRSALNTNAGGDYNEENAVCYLQILLANDLPNMSSARMMQDMDNWGYTFRLGSAKAWFENDAEDALKWLKDKGLVNTKEQPNYHLRMI